MIDKMISYAGNHEDVLLSRAFPEQQAGFYVDVGAHHPVGGSATKHFYDRGWHGVNVEPIPHLAALFPAARPRDVIVQAGLSDHAGPMKLFHIEEDKGLSTFSVPQANEYRERGLTVTELIVDVLTLADVCQRHVKDADIDFMIIDVEGYERQVLEGADFDRWRPRVLVVESSRPNTNEPTHQLWDELVLKAGYSFALFDGINRIYVRDEDRALLTRLMYPVNVLDNFVSCRQYELERKLKDYLRFGRAALSAARATQHIVNLIRAVMR